MKGKLTEKNVGHFVLFLHSNNEVTLTLLISMRYSLRHAVLAWLNLRSITMTIKLCDLNFGV